VASRTKANRQWLDPAETYVDSMAFILSFIMQIPKNPTHIDESLIVSSRDLGIIYNRR
jgi:hypothetical protein